MTGPTNPTRRSIRDAFDTAILPTLDVVDERVPVRSTSKRRWPLPVATILLAALGAGALVAAALSPTGMQAPTGLATSSAPFNASTRPIPTVAASTTSAARTQSKTPVSELADPAWVTRIAKAANIPERALAAYAGAAIETARTRPSCGLGWNTLAAIGSVETEHGTMHGARIAPDGITAPVIIGIPLDGRGVAEVSDTDDGRLDGDTSWDRAVGPMQFIPSSWAAHARDGNGDGETDVNQIDDAALTAASYLCEAGGDLAVAQNWITAIAAYNPSADYNNRVAETANHYATVK
ncbi:lytic transglycosylase domain-containing protein [Luethyella okanaganae]|uniref:Lytic transglycosylase domain-containing protein n=1 Tax=Luethyella okanaganae TaxID=69372 RepID=A0ABW1VCV2_9MICO